jgi:decaprenyl-phosphate phosphoribosyltransferase
MSVSASAKGALGGRGPDRPAPPGTGARPPGHFGTAGELVRALRPRQWSKNLLVLGAPLAGGQLGRPAVLLSSAIALAVFTAAAAGGYLLNDVRDVTADRQHPDKRLRPVAAGTLGSSTAVAWGVALTLAAAGAAALTDDELLPLMILYSGLTFAYGFGLKRVAGLEVVIVASGFVLRPLAGSAASNVQPSAWFLAVCCLAALVVAVGKRLVELVRLGPEATSHRAALGRYSVAVLGRVQLLALAGMTAAYLGWALGHHDLTGRVLAELSLVPLVATVGRVMLLNQRGEGGAPEELLLRDRKIQLTGLLWFGLFLAGVLHG